MPIKGRSSVSIRARLDRGIGHPTIPNTLKEQPMTLLDKIVAAVTPTETAEERAAARAQAQQASSNSPWLAAVVSHHQQIEAAFAAVEHASQAAERRQAQKRLATLLTGHSLAEEAVLYPAMALGDQKGHATAAYSEQSGAKINIAGLESIDPMSQDYLDKLEHVRNAVAHHVYEEESTWFLELARDGDSAQQAHLTTRYMEEFARYMGKDMGKDMGNAGSMNDSLGNDVSHAIGNDMGNVIRDDRESSSPLTTEPSGAWPLPSSGAPL
jgi:hypothetical protein